MQTNRASEARITEPRKALPCKYCGSILNKNGQHTNEWVRMQQSGSDKYRSRLYRVWSAMRERCNNPNQARFSSYGGRGIKVCDEWKDFAVFREWALSAGYAPGLQLDRIDNDKGYNPDNCRIATRSEQQQNRRLPTRYKTGKRYARCFRSEEDIYSIRESKLSNAALGNIYDINNSHARNIKLRKAWGDIPERIPVARQSVN